MSEYDVEEEVEDFGVWWSLLTNGIAWNEITLSFSPKKIENVDGDGDGEHQRTHLVTTCGNEEGDILLFRLTLQITFGKEIPASYLSVLLFNHGEDSKTLCSCALHSSSKSASAARRRQQCLGIHL